MPIINICENIAGKDIFLRVSKGNIFPWQSGRSICKHIYDALRVIKICLLQLGNSLSGCMCEVCIKARCQTGSLSPACWAGQKREWNNIYLLEYHDNSWSGKSLSCFQRANSAARWRPKIVA